MVGELVGERVRLVRWGERHAGDLARVADDEEIGRYLLPGFPRPYRLGDAIAWIDRQTAAIGLPTQFAIEVDGTLIGSTGFTVGTGERVGSLFAGYFIGKAFWGRGFATDAMRTLTAYGFTVPGVYRMWANVMGPNVASMRVLARAGYVREAILKNAIVDRDGNAHDEHIYTRFRDDATRSYGLEV
jgi:RimJ/RimL family protein N-acetyltransferase